MLAIGVLLLAMSHAQARHRHPIPPTPTAASLDAVNGAIQATTIRTAPSDALARPAGRPANAVSPRALGLRTATEATDVLALGARASQANGLSYLGVDLSAPVAVTAFVLADPDRIIVDLPATDFHIEAEVGRLAAPEGLIKSFRFGRFAPGRSRIVIDLTGPARIAKAASEHLASGDPARLVIALAPDSPANFAAAAARSAANEAAAAARRHIAPPKPATGGLPVIVLDPGHGGIDSGAAGSAGGETVAEKNLVFEFARALALRLEASRRYKVVLTRDGDTFVALDERVRLAREAHAALFISIHADTLSDIGDVSGATVYTVAERASDSEAAKVAEKENGADLAAGVSSAEQSGDVSDILFDLTRRETRAYSHVFARQVTSNWATTGRLNKNPERAAGFRVLRAPDVPSVLLELGYLSNDRDARSLVSPAWRERTTAGVVKAIDQFFAPRLAADGDLADPNDVLTTGSISRTVPAAPQAGAN